MAKRKMIQSNLIKNSISAYFAALEIHNKPDVSYRYETVTLLFVNAWELILKAYVRKYQRDRSIFTKEGHTISLDVTLDYVTEHRNHASKNSFTAVKENILEIEKYRNNITHFYCDDLEPYIFMLVARSALNYVDFVKQYFGKDIMADEGLFILPLGFKLPFRPEDFLSRNISKYAASQEAQDFINDIIHISQELKEEGIEESIVLGFDVGLSSIKRTKNSDIIAAVTTNFDEADLLLAKKHTIHISEDAKQKVSINDDQFYELWPNTYEDLIRWCRENIDDFKQNKTFYDAKKTVEEDHDLVFIKKLNPKNEKSSSQKFYSDNAFEKIKDEYLKLKEQTLNG